MFRRMMALAVALVVAASGAAVGAGSQTVSARTIKTVQIQAIEVGTVYGKDPSYPVARSVATGCDSDLRIGQSSDGIHSAVYRSFVRFDLSMLPESGPVVAAWFSARTIADLSLSAEFDVSVLRVNTWQSPLCLWAAFNYLEPGTNGVLEGILYNTGSSGGIGVRTMPVDPAWIIPGGEVRYSILSSRDLLAAAPSGNEWIQMSAVPAPVLTVSYSQ